MKRTKQVITALLPLLLCAAGAVAGAQGKGQGKDKDRGNQGKGKDKDRSADVRETRKDLKEARKNLKEAGKDMKDFAKGKDRDRVVITESGGNVHVREFIVSDKRGHRLAGLAVASAARHRSDDPFVITPVGNRVQVLNRSGVVLVDFEDDRELGNWSVVTEPFKDKRGAPSFCRSGAGHPVWGRQWCVEKGFGLGVDNDLRWSRVLDPSNVVITRPATTGDLTRDVLMDVLGSVVLNRLATHAVTLGLQDPLVGRWIGESADTGPRVLLVSSGTRPVAEMVDTNRDGRADLMLVSVR
jgi:hypothetical protein